jgi:hypothetical protein
MEQNILGRLMLFYDTILGWQCYSYLFFSPIAGTIRETPLVPALPSLPH